LLELRCWLCGGLDLDWGCRLVVVLLGRNLCWLRLWLRWRRLANWRDV
jgi:hypothetical protein